MKTTRRLRVCLFAFAALTVGGLVAAVLLLARTTQDIEMSVLSIWKEKDGVWWTTLLLSNKLDVPVGFEWLDSENRDFQDKRGEKLPAPTLAAPCTLSPREALNFALTLPPPGTARRFRIRYFIEGQQESRFHALLHSFRLAGEWHPSGSVAVSPDVSADSVSTY